jgi:hypothetical protein
MLQVLIDISLKVLLQKRDMGYAKVIQKKKIKEKKEFRKNVQVFEIFKTMGT